MRILKGKLKVKRIDYIDIMKFLGIIFILKIAFMIAMSDKSCVAIRSFSPQGS